jgi:hypothetical protein
VDQAAELEIKLEVEPYAVTAAPGSSGSRGDSARAGDEDKAFAATIIREPETGALGMRCYTYTDSNTHVVTQVRGTANSDTVVCKASLFLAMAPCCTSRFTSGSMCFGAAC